MLFIRRQFRLAILFWIGLANLLSAQESRSNPRPTESRSTRKVYALQFKSPDDAARVLRPLLESSKESTVEVDPRSRAIIVRGPEWAQQCARQVVETLDIPTVPWADVESTIVAYRISEDRRDAIEKRINRQYANSDITLSIDSQAGLMFVRANQRIHGELATWLTPINRNETTPLPSRDVEPKSPDKFLPFRAQPLRRLPATNETARVPVPQAERRFVAVQPEHIVPVRRQLVQLLGNRLQPGDDSDTMNLSTASGDAQIQVDERHGEFVVEGAAVVVDQVSRMIDALSRQSFENGKRRQQVVPLHRDTQPRIREVIRPAPSDDRPEKRQGTRRNPTPSPVQPASYNRRQPGPLSVPIQGVQEPSLDDPQQKQPDDERSRLAQFEGVEIELLPDLDAIILRGRDQELKQLAEIIRQLEQISRETQPAIEIVPLNFAGSQRVATIIQQTQANLIGTRQGRATVTSLVKPNAMLVIGWGEAVKALVELIEKLDQPVEGETQFDVIRLQFATASIVQQTLTSFYASRQGLGPIIQSTADVRTNSIIVHAAPRDMVEVRELVERLDVPQGATVHRARVFMIEHSLAADIAQLLQQAIQPPTAGGRAAAMELLLDNGEPVVASGILENTQITVNPRNNSLIVAAPPANMPLIESLIRQLDTPGMIAKIKIFPVQNGDAATLVETLRSLIPSQVGPNTGSQLSSAPGESSLAPLRFTVDARSNSLIATGSEGDLRIVEALILRLDENDSMQRRSIVYQLKNAAAVDVALTINEFLRTNRQVETAGPGRASPFQQMEKEVVVVPEPVANKLVLSATPRYFEEISKLIEKLDQQPAQVMIQVLIAEVALSDAEEFGVELGIQDSVLFDRSLLGNLLTTTNTNQTSTPAGILTQTQQTIVSATNQPGFDFNSTRPLGNSGSAQSLGTAPTVGGQGLSNFDIGRGSAELGFGGLVLSASSQNLSILMRALQESRRIDVLSRPQVLTLDNQPAFIQVGQRVPRIIGSIVNQAGQQNNVALENVGLILGVTPRISPEGTVVMEIDAEKSDLGPEIEGIPVSVSANGTIIRSPRINTTTAQATVSAASGETIILGGLITKANRTLHRKVPYLGDMPYLGTLFRFDSQAQRRTELLIILTPHVVRSQEDMQRLKQVEVARMSWCAADVFDVHGDIGVGQQLGLPSGDGELETVFPDVDPRGRQRTRFGESLHREHQQRPVANWDRSMDATRPTVSGVR